MLVLVTLQWWLINRYHNEDMDNGFCSYSLRAYRDDVKLNPPPTASGAADWPPTCEKIWGTDSARVKEYLTKVYQEESTVEDITHVRLAASLGTQCTSIGHSAVVADQSLSQQWRYGHRVLWLLIAGIP